MTRAIETPEQLREVMHADFTFSDQQFAAITAPLEPAVVIAGAGSGKTTVMAARVVWLVATGQVAPAEVLGLTFTTKATAELATRIRESLRAAGLLPARVGAALDARRAEEVEEPTVATYHSYAAGLLTEHGLRIGHEPDTRLIADASRYQLAGRTIARHTAPVRISATHLSWSCSGCSRSTPSSPSTSSRPSRSARSTPASARCSSRAWPARAARPTAPTTRRRSSRSTGGPSSSTWSRSTARSSATTG